MSLFRTLFTEPMHPFGFRILTLDENEQPFVDFQIHSLNGAGPKMLPMIMNWRIEAQW